MQSLKVGIVESRKDARGRTCCRIFAVDPVMGMSLDPVMRMSLDPVMGMSLDPVMGMSLDPLMGMSLDGNVV